MVYVFVCVIGDGCFPSGCRPVIMHITMITVYCYTSVSVSFMCVDLGRSACKLSLYHSIAQEHPVYI